jgi:hypothetical protein
MKKLIKLSLTTLGFLLFIHAEGQETPPAGPNFPCPWGYAKVYRLPDPQWNLAKDLMCDCSSTDWFKEDHYKNKLCQEYIK